MNSKFLLALIAVVVALLAMVDPALAFAAGLIGYTAAPTHYVQQYTTNVELLLQQKGSKLRGCVFEKSGYVGKGGVVVDQYGQVTAQRRTTRYPPIVPSDTPNDRRWVYPVDYDWADMVDHIDRLRMLIDPTSHFVVNGTYAMGRAMDNEIIAAFFGTSKTGETGSTDTTFPSGQVVAVNFESSANVGLTVAKLREAKRLLMAAEVDLESDPLFCAITAKQHDDLLKEAQAISLDYNSKPVLVEGKITSFMGFNFVHTELLQNNATPYRLVPAWAKSGMHLGSWDAVSAKVSQREDLRGMPWQVYLQGTFGATRTQERKITQILCNEA